jgi:hypothetical protein
VYARWRPGGKNISQHQESTLSGSSTARRRTKSLFTLFSPFWPKPLTAYSVRSNQVVQPFFEHETRIQDTEPPRGSCPNHRTSTTKLSAPAWRPSQASSSQPQPRSVSRSFPDWCARHALRAASWAADGFTERQATNHYNGRPENRWTLTLHQLVNNQLTKINNLYETHRISLRSA